MIIKLWGILQKCEKCEKCEKLLKELKKSKNNFISDSAEYCLIKIYEKKEKRELTNDDYKEIFNQKLIIEKNSITNIHVEKVTGAVVNNGELNQSINQENTKIIFDYEGLLNDLILISKQLIKNVNSIKFEKENPINDKFISGLELQKYNVAGENRVNNGNERDIIIKDENQSERAIIEALRITSISTDYIKKHYDKLIGRYDVMGHPVGYLLIYVKNKNFEDIWERYKTYLSKFTTFEDTDISNVANIKVGKNNIENKIIYHVFINFDSNN